MEEPNMARLTQSLFIFACAATVACNGGDTDDTDTDGTPCNISQVDVFPAPDETTAYYRTSVEALFKPVADANAILTVSDDAGAAITGSSAWRGNALVFSPDAPLTPGSSYITTLDYGCDNGETKQITASWMTSVVGTSTDAPSLVGNAYILELGDARFVKPEGIGALLSQYLTVDVLIGIESTDNDQIKMIGAIAEEDSEPPVQAADEPTIDFPVADFSENPYFSVTGDEFVINVEDYSITIDDFSLSGDFAPDGTYIDGVTLIGSIDTRPLVPLLGDESSADDAICVLASTLNINCEACPDGTGDFCLSLEADSISAPQIDTTIVPIEDAS